VPRYQRPYSWPEELVEKLVQDLLNAWERNGNYYYIGTMVLVGSQRRNEWRVADGQQRLATMTMIFAFMRDKLCERGEFLQIMIKENPTDDHGRLRLRPKDDEFFYEFVQLQGHFHELCGRDKVEEDHSQARMCGAADMIVGALGHMNDAELEDFAKFMCRAALFTVTYAHEPGGAALVFATVNSGLELSHADLLKFALLETAAMHEREKEAAAVTWEELETQLGREEFGELLKLVPIMITGERLRAPGDLAAFAQALSKRTSVENFLRDWLPRHGEALIAIRNGLQGGAHAVEINRRIACLKQLKDQNWLPVAVSFLAEHAGEHERLIRFFRGVDLIAFGTLLGALRPEAREKRWKRALAAKGEEGKLYHPKTGPLCLHEFDDRMSERERFLQRLGEPFKRDHKKDAEKRALLLIRINACLGGGDVLEREPGELTVEHILPSRGGGEGWLGFTPEQRAIYPHLIGNWTLITRKQNELCGAKPYAAKKDIYFRPEFPLHAITEMLADADEWGPREIDLRGQFFQRMLFQDWGI
jgi:hypothetical protein